MSVQQDQVIPQGATANDGYYIICCKLPNGYTFTGSPWGDIPLQGSRHSIVAGFGMTRVPIYMWEWIVETHSKDSLVLKNEFIFAAANEHDANILAKDRRSLRSGMEQKHPEKIIKDAEKVAGNATHKEIQGFVQQNEE